MKNRIIASIALILIATLSYSQETVLKNRKDSVSYAVGVSMYDGTMQFGFTMNYDMVSVGFLAAADSMAKMDTDEANAFIQKVMLQLRQQEIKKNKEMGQAFLEKNKKQEGIIATETGLQYRIIKQGAGKTPTIDQKVKVNYTGYLLDGTKFDSSEDRGGEAVFSIKNIIPGWQQALTMMPVGSEWVIYVPADLGYGERTVGDIPPGSTMIFEIQLLDIWQPAQNQDQ